MRAGTACSLSTLSFSLLSKVKSYVSGVKGWPSFLCLKPTLPKMCLGSGIQFRVWAVVVHRVKVLFSESASRGLGPWHSRWLPMLAAPPVARLLSPGLCECTVRSWQSRRTPALQTSPLSVSAHRVPPPPPLLLSQQTSHLLC